MIREIYEQPKTIAKTLADNLPKAAQITKNLNPEKLGMVYFTGSGTSYHACLAANYALTTLTRIFGSSLPASEFSSWVKQTPRQEVLVVAVSQSGESADAISAVNSALSAGMHVAGITNSPSSTLAKMTKLRMVSMAEEEQAVTATKSFTATLAASYALVIELARTTGLKIEAYRKLAAQLRNIHKKVGETIRLCDKMARVLATEFKEREFFFMLGSGANYSTALEGALKLKETCNVHAEGFASREFLHGPMQLVDEQTPVFILEDSEERGQVSRLAESFMRFGAPTVLVRQKNGGRLPKGIRGFDVAPGTPEVFSPLVYVIPLQLYAYYSSVIRGLNPDRPEKLTKVVR